MVQRSYDFGKLRQKPGPGGICPSAQNGGPLWPGLGSVPLCSGMPLLIWAHIRSRTVQHFPASAGHSQPGPPEHFERIKVNLGILTVASLGILALFSNFATAMIEAAVAVKLQWRRTPEFIAFALTVSLFAVVGALIGGLYVRHTL